MHFRQIFHRLKVLEFSILIAFVCVIISLSKVSANAKINVQTQKSYTFEQKFGIGLIKSSVTVGTVLKFYQNPNDKKPYKTLNFEQIFQNPGWFLPKFNRIDGYKHILLLCHSRKPGWFEIELNSKTKKISWVKEEDGFAFKEWGEFLTEVFSIETNQETNAIHEQPDDKTPPLAFHEYATIDAKGHKGDWLQVKERFDEVAPPNNHQPQTGWLKWRNENEFLIKYNLSY